MLRDIASDWQLLTVFIAILSSVLAVLPRPSCLALVRVALPVYLDCLLALILVLVDGLAATCEQILPS